MKKLYTVFSLAMIFIIASCSEDIGNYEYSPVEVITIKGIDNSYTKLSGVERITLDPEVSTTANDADFEYFWGIYETNVQGYAPKIDTIAKTKALDYLIKQPAKGWVLVFRAKNKKTGYFQYVTSSVNVVTQYTRGWYVVKDDGTQTDVDLFKNPTNIIPETKVENVFSLVNGKKLNGKASLFSFLTAYKSSVTGVLGNTRALFVVSDNDATVVDINTFKEIRGFNSLFYESPSNKAPNFVTFASQANYFVNDGQVYAIYTMSANTGQFGVRKMRDNLNTPYKVSKYFMTYGFSDPIFFDETSSSFISSGATGNMVNAVSDAAATKMKANNNNKKLLFMGNKNTAPFSGYAVFQDKTDPNLKILSSITPALPNLTIINDTLKVADKLYNATNYTLLQGDENMLYFTVGNQVWSRNLSNKFEQLQYTVPAGEEITFIRHRKYTGSGAEAPYSYNYVMVGTKIGANYKVRMFTKTSGNLSANPVFTLDGTGSVGDVIYISPSISESTYTNTF
ncbi:PKD-like family lipoprotein [Solitalea lacus]|uniref:PKD-like family lipoprotein n=1 Tax=Solitalea lacus TaxID=2911172 RepID=UPI001EDC0E6E|nr:PKD-like family lipoprotein [Solitalea lacus]UKJ08556.1 hypothetical protein L2B55_05175 [Solitalea lacus]